MPQWPGRRFLTVLGLTSAMIAGTAGLARAQGYGDPDEGHRLARRWCGNCHVVEPRAHAGSSTGAPTFPAIARMKGMTPMALRVFLQTPHGRMPDLHLTRTEIDDLISYIGSLRRR